MKIGTNYFWLVLLIIIIATFFRLYHITSVPAGLYPDEAIGGNQGLEAVRTGEFKLFYPENNGRSGLFVNLQGISAALFGPTEPWTLRFPSALLGILTVLGLYFLAAELFSKQVSLVASFFLATNFWHINFSRIGFDGIAAPFFLVWSIFFLLKALSSKNARYSLFFAVCSGLIYGLGFHTYIAYRVTPLLILFIIGYSLKTSWNDRAVRKKVAVSAFCFLLFSFLAALPMGVYFLQHPGDISNRTSQISVFSSAHPLKDLSGNIAKTLTMFNFRGDGNWRHNYPGSPELFWPIGILFVTGIIFGVRQFWRKNFGLWILFIWFALGAAPAVFSNEGLPHSLRSILMVIPAIIFAAVGGIWVYKLLKKSPIGIKVPALSIIFLLFVLFEAYRSYFAAWAKNPDTAGAFNADYVTIGQALNKLPASVPKYVIVEAGGVPVDGIPMPAQTVMFVSDTYSKENQMKKNVHYILPNQTNTIPAGAVTFTLR